MKRILLNTTAIVAPTGAFMPRVVYYPDDLLGGANDTGAGADGAGADDTSGNGGKPALEDVLYNKGKNDDSDDSGTGSGADADADDTDAGKEKPTDDDADGSGGKDDADDGKDDDDSDVDNDGENDDEAKAKAELAKVPGEKEDYKLTMPEGMEIDKGLMDALSPLWKEGEITHAAAQKMADAYIKERTKEMADVQAEWDKTTETNQEAARTDKEFGGADFKANLKLANNVLDKYGNDGLSSALDGSGLNNNPEFIRFLLNVSKGITDDDMPGGKGTGSKATPKTEDEKAELLFGGTTPKNKKQ